MVIDLLTQEDKDKIDAYRRAYAEGCECDFAHIEDVLRFWNTAKSGTLSKIFKDSLIISTPITYTESQEEMSNKATEIINTDIRCYNFRRSICNTLQDYYVDSLFWGETLAENKISFDHIYDIEGHIIKAQSGEKPMKVIAKIAEAIKIGITPDENGISDLEYFRRKMSLVRNQKSISGNLCLSIHPLDYMTMSDNVENWDSCMSWRSSGDYRQGTVEMMNSSYVVVGYIPSTSHQITYPITWNSKKWRCLFIVTEDYIISVKSYPYHNDEIVKTAVKELAARLGWETANSEPINWGNTEYRNILTFNTYGYCMYNDMGLAPTHYLITATEESAADNLCYCGESECMWCGETDTNLIGEEIGCDALSCSHCYPSFCCDSCEEHFDYDPYMTADGYALCEYCYDNYTWEDCLSGEHFYETYNKISIYLVNEETKRIGNNTVDIDKDNLCCLKKEYNIDENNLVAGMYGGGYYLCIEDCPEKAQQELFDYWPQKEWLNL